MGLLGKLRDMLGGGREYIVMLSRRGGRKVLGKIRARSLEEAISIATKMVTESEDPDVTRAKTIKLLDTYEAREYDVDNPRYEAPEETEKKEKITTEDVEQVALATVINHLPTIVGKSIDVAFSVSNTIMSKLMELQFRQLERIMGQMYQSPQDKVASAVSEFLIALARDPRAFVEALRQLATVGSTPPPSNSSPAELAKMWLAMGAPTPRGEQQ